MHRRIPSFARQVLTPWLIAFLAVTGPAQAAPDAAAQASVQACRADFRKFCDGVRPGGGRGLACLKKHESELGGACGDALAQAGDCLAQARKLCGPEPAASGADADKRRACVKEHDEELRACKAPQ